MFAQIDLFVLHAQIELFDKDIVHPAPLPIHADAHRQALAGGPSITAQTWMFPHGMGTEVMAAHHTWFGRWTSSSCNK